jgi:hypothetical protein
MPYNNRYRRPGRFLFFPLVAAVILLLLGGVVMLLWNAVLPVVVHAAPLTYRQAVALLLLCRILFGSFNRHLPPQSGTPMNNRGAQWREKLMRMTPEERERFRQQWKSRCRK